MKITIERSHSAQNNAQQVVPLERGLCGGMFANYSKPITKQKYQSSEMETRIVLSFLVTHGADERPLPRFGEAVKSVSLKLYRNPENGKHSHLFGFYAAILKKGKYAMTHEQILKAEDNQLPDLDELIGYPVMIMLEPSRRPSPNGCYRDNVKEFYEPRSL